MVWVGGMLKPSQTIAGAREDHIVTNSHNDTELKRMKGASDPPVVAVDSCIFPELLHGRMVLR